VKLSNLDGSKITVLDSVAPGDFTSVPLEYVHDGLLFFRPVDESKKSFFWSSQLRLAQLAQDTFYMSLPSTCAEQFFYCVEVQVEQTKSGIKLYTIKVLTPVVLENLLPCNFKYQIHSTTELAGSLESGEEKPNYCISLNHPIKFRMILPGFNWSEETNINAARSGIIKLEDKQRRLLVLYFEHSYVQRTLHIVIYAKYWIVNRTQFNLRYYNGKGHLAAGQDDVSPSELKLYNPVDWHVSGERIATRKPLLFSFPDNRH